MVQNQAEKEQQTQRERGYLYYADDDNYDGGKRKPNPCLPPEGKTYLTIGQDLFSVQEYLEEQYNASLHWYMKSDVSSTSSSSSSRTEESATRSRKHRHKQVEHSYLLSSQQRLPVPIREDVVPAAVMVYTDIQTLKGLDQPVDYGTGIEYADGLLRMVAPPHTYYDVGLQVGLWLNGTQGCQDMLDGKLDDQINQLVHYLGNRCEASKVFLRIGYEFDNPDFQYFSDPKTYRHAFRYLVEKCHKHSSCRRRVITVWHSWAAGLPDGTKLGDYYPGDEFVDWVGISLFQQFYPTNAGGTVRDLQHVLEFASKHDKPTMIAESTPYGGIHDNAIIKNNKPQKDIWAAWFQPTINFIDRYNISMWSYINCNWNVQPLWQNANFGDTRISIDDQVTEQWLEQVVSNPRFILATDDELCGNAPYPYLYKYDYSYDDDFQYSGTKRSSRSTYHSYSDYHYRDDDHFSHRMGPDDYNIGSNNGQIKDDNKKSKPWWSMWGERRQQNSDGLWNVVLPLVMLSSSIAIIVFLYLTKNNRRRPSRLEQTPRARRVRFAKLDELEDDEHDGVVQKLYGSSIEQHYHHHHHYHYGAIDDDDHEQQPDHQHEQRDTGMDNVASNSTDVTHWKRSVRRIGPNLVVTNTTEGSTVTV